jgi:hypothetical protein
MKIDEIRALRRADPFEPFHLVMLDGRKLPVDRAHYLAISPDGMLVAHASVDGWFEWFPPANVARVDFNIDAAAVDRARATAADFGPTRRRA